MQLCMISVSGANFLSRSLKTLIQQIEGTEGRLSDIERKACEILQKSLLGRWFLILESSTPVTISEAILKNRWKVVFNTSQSSG